MSWRSRDRPRVASRRLNARWCGCGSNDDRYRSGFVAVGSELGLDALRLKNGSRANAFVGVANGVFGVANGVVGVANALLLHANDCEVFGGFRLTSGIG